jgi:hypothetical protein
MNTKSLVDLSLMILWIINSFIKEMKIYLAAEQQHIKDKHPFGDLRLHLQRSEDEPDQKEKQVNDDGPIAQYHQSAFQPGQLYHPHFMPFCSFIHLDIPEHHCGDKAEVAENGKFGEKSHNYKF